MTRPVVGHAWQAFSRDAGYQLSGPLPISTVKGVRRHLGVDTCELVTPYTPDAYGRLAPGCGIVVQRDGVQQFSGLVGSSRRVSWDGEAGSAVITVQCLGDDVHLADRLAYPTPAASPTAQADNYWLWPRTDTAPVQTQAAMQILQRIVSGQPIFEDWTWRGMPPFIDTYNDTLIALYLAANPGASTTDALTSAKWLDTYVNANSTPVAGQRNAPASTAIWRLINEQAGPGAQSSRRVPTLVMGPDPGVGSLRQWSVQWASVLDTCEQWGVLSGADLGVRLTTTADGLRADVYVPRDLASSVRFSANLANLVGWELEQAPPDVTYAVAAGQGNLGSRTRRVSQSLNASDLAWGRRIERYVDQRDEADTTKLQTSADDAVADGIGTTSLSLDAADTATAPYGTGWDLGDRVTVYVGLPGGATAATVVDLVREVLFEVSGSGAEKITPAVGTADAAAIRPGPAQAVIGKVAAGLARLTRNQ